MITVAVPALIALSLLLLFGLALCRASSEREAAADRLAVLRDRVEGGHE